MIGSVFLVWYVRMVLWYDVFFKSWKTIKAMRPNARYFYIRLESLWRFLKMFYQLRRNSLCLKAIGEITTQSKATLNSLNSKEEDQAIVHKLKDKSKTNSRSHPVDIKPEPGLHDQTSYAPTPSSLPETILRAPLPLNNTPLMKLPFVPKSIPTTTFHLSAKR